MRSAKKCSARLDWWFGWDRRPKWKSSRAAFQGQLTATIHMDAGDLETARRLRPVLERKAGRVLVNGFPTGVEVVDSMVHGGPYPASTNFGATSVGTMSIRRFLRPVAYQNMPEDLLPRTSSADPASRPRNKRGFSTRESPFPLRKGALLYTFCILIVFLN